MKPEHNFWLNVSKLDSGCWVWTRGKITSGYGCLVVNRKTILAHRYAWELTHGPIPKGMCICHHCDNPPCVRPDHLFLGTYKDNSQDASRKGRFKPQIEAAKRLRELGLISKRGEANSNSKLTTALVLEMRRLHATEKWGYKRLHKHFGISFGVAQRIINRKSWKHV